MGIVSKNPLSPRPEPEQGDDFMSRSGLGRGLGNLLSDQGVRGDSTPGSGVIRLMRPTPPGTTAPAQQVPPIRVAIPRPLLAGAALPGLWIADGVLSVMALWLGGCSSMAGLPESLWFGGGLVAIATFLGLAAAGVFAKG